MSLLEEKKIKQSPQNNGLLMCARYAFMPNKLQYCGGPNNNELFAYNTENITDPGLNQLLQEFQTLFPYLKLIAEANRIKDPFDYSVVEAYWLGNNLLDNVPLNRLYYHFIDNLSLKKKLTPRDFEILVGKIPQGAIPHHCFHVLNIYFRTGHLAVPHTLLSMDSCRINWGKIIKVEDTEIVVETQKLNYSNNKLQLEPDKQKVLYKLLNKSFISNPHEQDLVSFHWGWVCEKISKNQMLNLKKYTQACLDIANNIKTRVALNS